MPRAPRKSRPAPVPSRAELADKLPLTGPPWGGLAFAAMAVCLLGGVGWLVWCASVGRPVWPW